MGYSFSKVLLEENFFLRNLAKKDKKVNFLLLKKFTFQRSFCCGHTTYSTYNGGQKSLERLWKTFLPHP